MIQFNFNDISNKVRSVVLDGLNTGLSGVISATDTVLSALGKLQNQITSLKNEVESIEVTENHSDLNLDDGSNPHGTTKGDVGLGNVDNVQQYPASNPDGFETPAELDARDTANRNRDNHTGTQPANTITGLADVATSNDYNDLDNLPDLSSLETKVEQYPDKDAFPKTGDSDVLYIAQDTGFLYRWTGSEYVQLTDQTAVWGFISGDISDQSDLQGVLNDKLEQSDIDDFETSTELDDRDTANRNRSNHTGTQAIGTVDGLQAELDAKANDADISIVGKSNDYNDLDNLPTIPTPISDHSELNLDDGTNPHGTTKADVGLGNVDNTSDADKPISNDTQAALDDKLEQSDIDDFETTSELNDRDAANRDRDNHTGTQSINTVDGLQAALDDKADDSDISTVGKTNDYNDLDNLPTIPTVITDHSGLNLDDGTNPHGTTKSDVGLSNVDNVKQYPNTNPLGFETPTELNARDAANRDRDNHTGTQGINTITGLQAALDDKAEDASNVGGGIGLYIEKDGETLRFRTIEAGNNVTIDDSDPEKIVINASGNGGNGGIVAINNIGATSSNVTIDGNTHRYHIVTMEDSFEFNLVDGGSDFLELTVEVEQGSSGDHEITDWTGNNTRPAGIPPQPAQGAGVISTFHWQWNGSNWRFVNMTSTQQ